MTDMTLSKKGERSVSPFVGQELLYDFLRGELDPERHEAMEKSLSRNRDLKLELEKIREGYNYAIQLRDTGVSAQLTESIRTPSTYFQVLLQKTKLAEVPEGIKLAGEGLLIGVCALILILTIPWARLVSMKDQLAKPSLVLSEVAKSHHADPDDEAPANVSHEANQAVVYDDETKVKPTPAPKVAIAAAKALPLAESASAGAPNANLPAPAPIVKAQAATSPDASEKKQGFLYRGSISVTNLPVVTPKLVEFIETIGGRKAGEVGLGWKKGESDYFHFTMPEAKYQALVDLLKGYGTLKISKEPHPRVMPDGIIRLIITVDEKTE